MTSDQEGKAILKLIRGQNKKEVAIISLNNDYGEAILKVLEKSKTIKIISEEKYNLGEKDFKSILTKVKSLNPEIIILIGYSEVGTILKQAKGLGIGCLFISGAPFEGEDTLKNAEGSAEEVLYVFHKTTQSKESYFYTNYLKKYEKQPSIYSIFAYDSTKLLLETIKKNKNNTQIKDYLLKNIFMGEGRQIKFNNNGDLENPETVVKIVKQGKFILYNQ